MEKWEYCYVSIEFTMSADVLHEGIINIFPGNEISLDWMREVISGSAVPKRGKQLDFSKYPRIRDGNVLELDWSEVGIDNLSNGEETQRQVALALLNWLGLLGWEAVGHWRGKGDILFKRPIPE